MLLKNALIIWTKKLIYSWLIFCIGGVGSLTYFDGFAPGHEHGEHPFHLSIFEETDHHHKTPAPQPEALAAQIRFWRASRLNPQIDFISANQNLGPSFSRFFSSGLSDGYLLTTTRLKIFDLPRLPGSISLAAFGGQSAWLAPPEKPPSAQL